MSSRHPGCVIVLIDQSASMADPIAGSPHTSRAEAVATATDQLLDELVQRCVKDDDTPVMPYCDTAVIGYGGHGVRSMLGRGFTSTADLDALALPPAAPLGPHGAEPARRWITPVCDGITPMAEALDHTVGMLAGWVSDHPDSFPPVVLNITDGRANTTDPRQPAAHLSRLATSDGNVLLFNLHLSASTADMVEYPAAPPEVGDDFAVMLYAMSSVIPPQLVEISRFPLLPGARGFVFNGGAASLTRFFMWGTPSGPG